MPIWELKGVERIHLEPSEKKTVEFNITPRQMALIDEQGRCLLEPGQFRVYVGGQQPDRRSEVLTGKEVLSCEFEVTGDTLEIEY